jgi:hypothetical protein
MNFVSSICVHPVGEHIRSGLNKESTPRSQRAIQTMLSDFGWIEVFLPLRAQLISQHPEAIIRALHGYGVRVVLIHCFHQQF